MFPTHSTVITRADLNMPLVENKSVNLFRFTSFLPTLNQLLNNNNKIILITHLDKPNAFSLAPSTRILLPVFESYGYTVQFAQTIHHAHALKNDIILLENIRFMPQEFTNQLSFAQKVKKLGTFFVQDAFGSLHNHDNSIITLPTLFQDSEKSLGLLVQKEINQLDKFSLLDHVKTIYFLSGGKIKKIHYVYKLLEKKITIILGPALCTPFLCLRYHKNNCCIPNKDILALCFHIQKHYLFETHIILPIDLFIERNKQKCIIAADGMHADDTIISVGTQTLYIFKKKISEYDTIVMNGYMGFVSNAYCIEAMQYILGETFQRKHCLIGGGDTIFFVDSFTKAPSSLMRSTGGGAMLAYLAENTLPGLQSFTKKADTKIKNLTH